MFTAYLPQGGIFGFSSFMFFRKVRPKPASMDVVGGLAPQARLKNFLFAKKLPAGFFSKVWVISPVAFPVLLNDLV